ncbi:MAG: NUDIX hydrolase [Gammaproteobacteria bacterium]
MNYCSACGARVVRKVPPGDNLERFCCPECHAIHYQNPKIIAGTLTTQGNEVLLCKRSIEPRKGFWTLPAGFMENSETLDEAARRETLEETGARIRTHQIYSLFSLPHINQVYIFLKADLIECDFTPKAESEEVRLYRPEDIPWDALAFPTVQRTLKYFVQDLAAGNMPADTRVESVLWSRNQSPSVRFIKGFNADRNSFADEL